MGKAVVEPGKLYRTPIRKVNTRGSRNITGYVCTSKLPGCTIDRESTNELAFIKRAEVDPRVIEILSQPILIRYRLPDGSSADAYPDFAISIDGQYELHEVKPDAEFGRSDVADRLRRIADAAERLGYPYSVALASSLHRKCDRPAVEAAWRRVKRDVHPIIRRAVEDLLLAGPMRVGDILDATRGHRTDICDLHAMLAHGHVRADMRQNPDREMTVHARSSDSWFARLVPFTDPRGPSL